MLFGSRAASPLKFQLLEGGHQSHDSFNNIAAWLPLNGIV